MTLRTKFRFAPARWLALTGIAAALLACNPSGVLPDSSAPDAAGTADAARTPDAPAGDAPAADTPTAPPDVAADAPPGPLPQDSIAVLDPATEAHVRELTARGATRGNRREVLAKVGDSITESGSFLRDCGQGYFDLGPHADLEPTIRYFSMLMFDAEFNSLSRASLAAQSGWTVDALLNGGATDSPVARELDAIHPQWAVVMIGTNDLEAGDLAAFRASVGRVVDLIEGRAVVPILSTIPNRTDTAPRAMRVPAYNAALRALAAERHVPWVDYWAVLEPAPAHGMSDDGVHPNIFHDDMGSRACVFTPAALAFGYNIRNLITLQVLARVRGL